MLHRMRAPRVPAADSVYCSKYSAATASRTSIGGRDGDVDNFASAQKLSEKERDRGRGRDRQNVTRQAKSLRQSYVQRLRAAIGLLNWLFGRVGIMVTRAVGKTSDFSFYTTIPSLPPGKRRHLSPDLTFIKQYKVSDRESEGGGGREETDRRIG